MSSLKSKTEKALVWDLLGNYTGQIVGFIISIALARLLEPIDFGIIGLSLVIINISKIILDFGLTSALIQSKDKTNITYSSVFFFNVVIAFFLTVGVYFSSDSISTFFDSERLSLVVKVMSLGFFLSSLNIVQSTKLKVDLNFKALTIRDTVSQIIAGIIAIILAFSGFGLFSLVVQFILSELIKTILLWKISDWHPRFEYSSQEIIKLMSFSMYIFAGKTFDRILREVDTMIVGKLFSPTILGFYSKSNSLIGLINKNSSVSLTNVFYPVLVQISDNKSKFISTFSKSIDIVSGISFFLIGILYISAEDFIVLLYGQKWLMTAIIFKIILLKGFTYPINSMVVNVYLAKGLAKEHFYLGVIRKTLRMIPFLVAFLWGFNPFLYSFVAIAVFITLFNLFFVTNMLNISFWSQFISILKYLVTSLSLVLLIEIFIVSSSILTTTAEVLIFSVIYLAVCFIIKSEFTNTLMDYFGKVVKMLKRV